MTSLNTESKIAKIGRSAVGFCSIALRNSPVEEAISEIARGGFSVIELWHPHIDGLRAEELVQLVNAWSKKEISVSVLAPYFTFTRGLDKWRQSILLAERAVAAARAIRAAKIRTFIDIGPDGLPSGRAKRSDWIRACQALKTICSFDRNIDFVIETHDNTLADTLDSVIRLVEETAEPNLKINFQANTDFMRRGYLDCLERLWPYVAHMHWQQMTSDGQSTYIEEPGCIDFLDLGALLARRDYQGTISVEYCWSNLDRRRIATAHNFIKTIASKNGLNRVCLDLLPASADDRITKNKGAV